MNAQSKAIILARVSSKSQEDEGYSLDSQLKLLRTYCSNNGLRVIKEFKVAETASKQHSRIIFQDMVRFLKKEQICHLAVEKTDRLTRNMRDAVTIDDWLEGNDIRRLHAVKENLILHKNARSDVKLMWSIYLAFAKKYTDGLREEAMKGWAEKLAQGWLPSTPPPGYMTILDCGKRIHVPNPETMQLVQQAFELYLLPDHTIATITQYLSDIGLVNSKGKPHIKSRVAYMLHNPFYIGVNRFDGKDYPGSQEPLISKKLFDAVQEKLSGRTGISRNKHNPIFKGMIKCHACQCMISWSRQKGRYYGGCPRFEAKCREYPYLREDKVEAALVASLEVIKDIDGSTLKRLNLALDAEQKIRIGEFRQKMIKSLLDQITRIVGMKDALYDDKLSGYITAEKYEHKSQQLDEQKVQINGRLEKIYEAEAIAKPTNNKRLHKNPIANLYLKSTPTQKRIIITTVFEPIFTHNETIGLNYKYSI